ncbi:hypothetical protein LR48_Vigan05g025600 [Vigna angularis]|uniref:Uncharacterized protein n=2 Tax=Phaseolus angularis TaxID=3914 RepID=A0A0L9UJB7_PHAAN|nr:hypothetical protein LR48_Vigan05g025600 [Vigna angularis]
MSSSECVFELGMEFSEANNVLLMALMEETQEEEYYHGDDRLVSMIQSLEAEISDTEIAQMDDQDCSTSDSEADHWAEMNIISSLPFDEMNSWMPCGDEMMEHAPMEYEDARSCVGFQISKFRARVRIEREREITREPERSREKTQTLLHCCHRRLDVIGKVCTSEGVAEGKVRTGRDRCGARKWSARPLNDRPCASDGRGDERQLAMKCSCARYVTSVLGDRVMCENAGRSDPAQEDGRPQKIKSTLDLLVDARPYVRRWHMDGRLKVVQTLDQMDARPDAHPEGRSSRCGRSSRRSSRRTLVQKIVEKWTLVHKIGRSSGKLDAPPENWTLVVDTDRLAPTPIGQQLEFGGERAAQTHQQVSLSVPKLSTETFWRPPWGRASNPMMTTRSMEEQQSTRKMIRNHKKPRRAFGLDITISDQHQKLSTKILQKRAYVQILGLKMGPKFIINDQVQDRAVNPPRERGKALSTTNGKSRSLGNTPSSKQRTSGKSRSVTVEGREVKPSRQMSKTERPRGKFLSVPVEGRAVNPARLNVEGREVKSSRQMSKTERTSGKSRSVKCGRSRGKTLSTNVEDREVNSSRFLLKDERTSGKSRSVTVEGREVKPSRPMSKTERPRGKFLSVSVEGRAVNPARLNVEGREVKPSRQMSRTARSNLLGPRGKIFSFPVEGRASVFELGVEFSEANNVLLMSLMEETQEEEYYHGDDRLVSMIQSLEAEISDTEIAQMDDQDCSTSDSEADHWAEMNIISSLPFDEMNAWIPCGDEMMEHAPMEYEEASYIEDFQLCYGLFLQQQYRDTDYLAQGPSDK